MKPSVGRIVHYHPEAGVSHAAVIASVHSDTCVSLGVFDANGNHYPRTSVSLGDPEKSSTWSWPPRV